MSTECLCNHGLRETRTLNPFGALVGGEHSVGFTGTRAFGHGEYVSDDRVFLQDRLKFDACSVEVSCCKISVIDAVKRIGRDSRYLFFKTLL